MRRKSIQFKTFWNLMLVMILQIVVIHLSIFFIYQNIYIRNNTKKIESDLQYVVDILENTNDCDAVLKAFVKNNPVSIIFKEDGQVRSYHGTGFSLEIELEEDSMLDVSGVDGTESILVRTRTVSLQNGRCATVQMCMSLQQLKEAKTIAISLLPYTLLISVVCSFLFSYFYSRKITRPILAMRDSVKQMTELREKVRIAIANEDELGTLAADINELYESLLGIIDGYKAKNEEVMSMERERLDFFRGTSHELKTPLAKLSILTENMRYNIGKYKDRDRYLEESLKIIQELSDMISEILDGVKKLNMEDAVVAPISVRAQVEKIVENYRLIAKAGHQDLQVHLQGDFQLHIPEAELDKVLSNIIFNAIKHGLPEGEIRIDLDEDQLRVYNDAHPIPEEKMKNIWKGKYSLACEEGSNSSGLGLYITQNILRGYQISYRFAPFQKGYLFTIER